MLILLLTMLLGAGAATNDLSAFLQKGLFEEEANHDLKAAMDAYHVVVERFDQDRKLAATAIFRLGECYRKQGNTNAALTRYQRVLTEFPDQTQLVAASRQQLVALGGTSSSPSGAPASVAAREEQRRLILEEMQLLEQRLQTQRRQVQGGALSSDELVPTQRDILQLKRQLAALDAGSPPSRDLLSLENTPPTSEEAEEVKRIQALIRDSPDLVNAKIDFNLGTTRLHKAAEFGHLVVATFLVENGADIEAKNSQGQTPLYLAAWKGHKALLELLLARGGRVTAADNDGRTPLHRAAEMGYRNIVELLVARGADVKARGKNGATPLHLAAAGGFKAIAETLLAKGAEVNALDSSGTSPLHSAAAPGYRSVVELLLSLKADPNIMNKNGGTPLMHAVGNGHEAIAQLLLERGAEVNATDSRGQSALMLAIQRGDVESARLLLASRADVNIKMEGGYAALHLTIAYGPRPEIMELLLNAGANPDAQAANGETPLHLAVGRRDKGAIELLLAAHADVNLRSKSGNTPLAIIGETKNDSQSQTIAELLRKAGALTDFPRTDVIEVRRPSTGYAAAVFSRGTNDFNQFTLLELLAVHYGLVSAKPEPDDTGFPYVKISRTRKGSLSFPNLAQVLIRRAQPDGKGWTTLPVSVEEMLRATDPKPDVILQWGDRVEIPEADHPLQAKWSGFAPETLAQLKQRLARRVMVTLKGQSSELVLEVGTLPEELNQAALDQIYTPPQFTLIPALQKSGLLRASSDLSRIQVERRSDSAGRGWKTQLDCSNPKNAPDLWLRAGDRIEVPEKPAEK